MSVKEEVRTLWKLCFDDSDEFQELYFGMRYSDDVNIALREDGKLVAALQMLPYQLTLGGTQVRTSYISGACTHPDWRGRGAMRRLLAETHRRMYADGVLLSMLVPAEEWLFDYYARSGYTRSFNYVLVREKVDGWSASLSCRVTDETDCPSMEEHYACFSRMMALRSCCVQHSWNDFRAIVADLKLGGGRLLVARDEDGICGMAFLVMESDALVVKELLVMVEVARLELLRAAAQMFTKDEVIVVQPASDASVCLGMLRVINVKEVMGVLAVHNPDRTLHVRILEDGAVPANAGYFSMQGGKCIQGQQPNVEYRECSMNELASLLFDPERPYMSLMLN